MQVLFDYRRWLAAVPRGRWWLVGAGGAALVLFLWWLFVPAPAVSGVMLPPAPPRALRPGGRPPQVWAKGALQPEDEPAADDPAAAVRAPGGLPDQLTRRDLEAAMEKVKPRLAYCGRDGASGIVQVKITILPTGAVQSAEALPPMDMAPLGACAVRVARAAVFPRFRGVLLPTMELTYPLVIKPDLK